MRTSPLSRCRAVTSAPARAARGLGADLAQDRARRALGVGEAPPTARRRRPTATLLMRELPPRSRPLSRHVRRRWLSVHNSRKDSPSAAPGSRTACASKEADMTKRVHSRSGRGASRPRRCGATAGAGRGLAAVARARAHRREPGAGPARAVERHRERALEAPPAGRQRIDADRERRPGLPERGRRARRSRSGASRGRSGACPGSARWGRPRATPTASTTCRRRPRSSATAASSP